MHLMKNEDLWCNMINVLNSINLIWGLHFIALLSAACIVMRTKKRFGEVLSATTAAVTSALLWIIACVTVYFLSENVPKGISKCGYVNVSCLMMFK